MLCSSQQKCFSLTDKEMISKMLERLKKLLNCHAVQRSLAVNFIHQQEIVHLVELRVVREFNLPDNYVNILKVCVTTYDGDPKTAAIQVQDTRILDSSKNQTVWVSSIQMVKLRDLSNYMNTGHFWPHMLFLNGWDYSYSHFYCLSVPEVSNIKMSFPQGPYSQSNLHQFFGFCMT